jgi:hypothetical protein
LTNQKQKLLLAPINTWPPQAILFSDWSILKKSSPLQPLGQKDLKLVGSVLERPFIKIVHLVPIRLQTWLLSSKFRSIWPSGFRGDDFLEIDQSETRIACGGHVFNRSELNNLQTWPPQAILISDWLISRKSSPLKLFGQMDLNLVESILGRSFIKIPNVC